MEGAQNIKQRYKSTVYGMYQGKGYDLAIIREYFLFLDTVDRSRISEFTFFGRGFYLIFQGEFVLLGELMALVSVGKYDCPAVAGWWWQNIQFQESQSKPLNRLFEIGLGLE